MTSTPPNAVEEAPPLKELVFFGAGNFWNGKKGDNPDEYYPNLGMNLFSSVPQKIPKNAKKRKRPREEWIREYMVDPSREHVVPLKQKPAGFENAKMYYTHDNGGRPFLVYITAGLHPDVAVYSRHDPRYYLWDEDWQEFDNGKDLWKLYTHRVFVAHKVKRVWLGKSDPKKWDHPGGRWSEGNTILVQVSPQKYVWIGDDGVYSFLSREQIQNFDSPVGPNDVPYPTAESENMYFFLLDQVKIPKKDFVISEDHPDKDLYANFFGHTGVKQDPGARQPLSGVTILQERN